MSVRMHHNHQHSDKLLLKRHIHLLKDLSKVLECKCLDQTYHGLLLHLLNPALLVGLKEVLVEFSHQTETGALVKEVKFLIVLVI